MKQKGTFHKAYRDEESYDKALHGRNLIRYSTGARDEEARKAMRLYVRLRRSGEVSSDDSEEHF